MKIKFLSVFVFFLIFLWVFTQIPRTEFWLSLGIYSILFIIYFTIYYLASTQKLTISHMLGIAIMARLVFFIGVPLHSDDFFRFFWDGQLVLYDINPYEYTPSELLDKDMLPSILKPIYPQLNSPEYFSVYPITNQAIFAGAAWVGGSSIEAFVTWLRVVLVFFEVLGVWILFRLLKKLGKDPNQALLYALNPLVLLEITGNLHFEGLMLTFLFLGIWALAKSKYFSSGTWIGIAVSVKLTPLIILPLVLRYLSKIKFTIFIGALILVCTLFFSPLIWWDNIGNFISSLQLYYGKFEFNASIYYLVREIGYLIKGYNVIESVSILFSLSVLILICYMAWKVRINRIQIFIQAAIVAYFIYLLLGMVVHPWYIIPLLGLGILGGKVSPIVWSYLIYLSYYAYSVEPYRESFILLIIQYVGLFVIAFAEYYPYLSPTKTKPSYLS